MADLKNNNYCLNNSVFENYEKKSQKRIKHFRKQQLIKFKKQLKKETPIFVKFLKHNSDNEKAQKELVKQKKQIDQRNKIRQQAATLLTNIGQADFSHNPSLEDIPKNEQMIGEEENSTISSNFTVMIGMLNGLLEKNDWLAKEISNNELKYEQYPDIIKELLRFRKLYNDYLKSIKIYNK